MWIHTDEAISDLLLQTGPPCGVGRIREKPDKLSDSQLERAQYDVEFARRRYPAIDPNTRRVTETLENAWNRHRNAQTNPVLART